MLLPADVIEEVDRRSVVAGTSREETIVFLLGRALSVGPGDGVDRTQIEQRLALTPAQRVARMAEETRRMQALMGARA